MTGIATSGDDLLYGLPTSEVLDGLAGNDTLLGWMGNDTLIGGSGNDLLGADGINASNYYSDEFGDDVLDGGDGSDILIVDTRDRDTATGGAGDDLIILSGGVTDTVSAGAMIDGGAGWDVVRTHFSLNLGALSFSTVERLEVVGSDSVGATGAITATIDQLNAFQQVSGFGIFSLVGAGGSLDIRALMSSDPAAWLWSLDATRLSGGVQVVIPDLVVEGLGEEGWNIRLSEYDDTAQGGSGDDWLIGNGGSDQFSGADGDDRLFGGSGTDSLAGGTGNDTLDGGAGADTLAGGLGDDTYRADRADVLVETATGGTDSLIAQVRGAWTLAAFVENFTWNGQAGVSVAGNNSANVMNGGSGGDVLRGAGGHDTLYGRSGDDKLFGGFGNDTLWGGVGHDTLTGGPGADVFVISAGPRLSNLTTITDFVDGEDRIAIDHRTYAVFAVGALPAEDVIEAAAVTPSTLGPALIYDTATGLLRYDADGGGSRASIVIAQLAPGLTLTSDDFVVV